MIRAAAAVLRIVVPVISTGLHCGEYQVKSVDLAIWVVPVISTGLHCGYQHPAARHLDAQVVPVISTGLHCGTAMKLEAP